ncbi:Protein kinase domain [Macleaya cordata]|uniref:Protein kinase domain n=1 Tax=Macleaya cordata TaxID=56857 RepID=A0A200QXN9_MACCD|nr:Protein kinase domain [Macleaya cordata]
MAMSLYNNLLIPLPLLFFIFFFLPTVNSLSFNIPRFDTDARNILLEGDAVASIGTIEMNKANFICRVGHATYPERVPLWDSATGKLSDFTTHFSFSIDTENCSYYGQGFAFFLAPVGFQIPPNSAGGFLGLFNTTTIDNTSHNQIIVVEFDTFVNPEWDPLVQHVGINKNSLASAVFIPWNASLHSNENANVWITYNATTKNLSVFWTYEENPIFQGNSLLSYEVDLRQVLPEWVTVGFSGTTGQYTERNTLLSWEFNSSLEVKETKGKNERKIKLVVGLSVSVGVLIGSVGIAVVCMLMLKRGRAKIAKEKTGNLTSINGDFERGAGPKRFSFRELVSATNNFSEERKLGEGGFGGVYRGFLNDINLAVAVKKISRGSRQGKKEYITEVKIISRLRHRNLVQLIGWCHERGEFLLVYELMPNGSLDSHLFGEKTPLAWAIRYKIALGLASALLYLHEEWEQCVVHRDVKSSNVMLDSNFNAKLGDFGLARLMDHELGPQTTGLAGTLGYLAPEYISTGKASKESDVFSFGVVALEIACGKKSVDPMKVESQVGLVEWVWDLYGRGGLSAAVDEKLTVDFAAKQVECLMIVGLWCAHPDRSFRPSIRQAIQVLNMEASIPNLPPKMPIPLYRVPELPPSTSNDPPITSTSLEVGH